MRRLLPLFFLVAGCSCSGEGTTPVLVGAAATEPPGTAAPEFAGRNNPLPDDAPTVAQGRALFLTNCATCHGPNADGKGPAAAGITPPPANFLDGVRLSSHDDAYLFWRVTTGKKGTAMPAFGSTLSDAERWSVLRYLRSLPNARSRSGS